MRRSVIYIAVAAGIAGTAAVVAPALAPAAQSGDAGSAVAQLKLADGSKIGTVEFDADGDDGVTSVDVDLDVPDEDTVAPAYHGLHVHANNDPANGEGCKADPDQPADTWFVAVDGHLKAGDEAHGYHTGDLPSIQLDDKGRGHAEYDASRISVDDLDGRAVVLHADADNFGNVPTGTGPDQYTANGTAATDKTAATGNAGTRLACGVLSTD